MKFWARLPPDGDYLEIRPAARAKLLAIGLKPGTTGLFELDEERSLVSHNHYFVVLTRAWENLPEDLGVDFPSMEHLRAWALIRSGHCTSTTTVCRTAAEARRLVTFTKQVLPLSVSTMDKNVVTVHVALSQSFSAMGKKLFQQSKDDVFNIVAGLLGCGIEDLNRLEKAEAADGEDGRRRAQATAG